MVRSHEERPLPPRRVVIAHSAGESWHSDAVVFTMRGEHLSLRSDDTSPIATTPH